MMDDVFNYDGEIVNNINNNNNKNNNSNGVGDIKCIKREDWNNDATVNAILNSNSSSFPSTSNTLTNQIEVSPMILPKVKYCPLNRSTCTRSPPPPHNTDGKPTKESMMVVDIPKIDRNDSGDQMMHTDHLFYYNLNLNNQRIFANTQ
jgi:hypothetical protein